jgi:glycosyltransferase involved in cell wall biosynthesis
LLDTTTLDASRLHVVPLGGPGAYAMPGRPSSVARSELGLRDDAVYALFFGLIKRHKGLDLLLDAFAQARERAPSLRLLVAGEPVGDWSGYERQIATLGLQDVVDLRLAFVPSELLPLYFSAVDLVVLPYRTTFQSGVALAAYAYERPVLATAVGGLPELVDDEETGLLSPPDDAGALADRLVAAAADPERLRELGKTGHTRSAERHGWPLIAARHEEIYVEALGRTPG